MGGVPITYILLRGDDTVMQILVEVISAYSPGEAVQMSMEDGLLEDAMFPEYHWSIVLGEEVLSFTFQVSNSVSSLAGASPKQA